MKIESILNQSTGPEPEEEGRGGKTPQSIAKRGFTGPSFSLPTPSPECLPSKTAVGHPDSRIRTPWDAGGYSLPRDTDPKAFSRSSFSFNSPRERIERQRPHEIPTQAAFHSRHMSMETPMSIISPGIHTPYSRPVRRMHSTSDVQHDMWTPKSHHGENRPSHHARRSSVWTDYSAAPSAGSHRFSESRSSFSSCCSSTFSAGHSRISSISTINGSHPLGSGIADLEAKLERLPRLTAPLPAPGPTPSPKLHAQPLYANVVTPAGSLLSNSQSDSVLGARITKRKSAHLSEGHSNPKIASSLLDAPERVHKRTISAPNPPHISTPVFARIPTSLPSLASAHFEAAVSPPPYLSMSQERAGSEQSLWARANEHSPAAGLPMRSASGENHQGNNRVLTPNDLQVVPRSAASPTTSPDRFLSACRRFRLNVNKALKGGDICMQVENCTTGSVPRKVISHLFGRNKVCTRRIPERVWVCMCRKHYQRVRYRRGADFSVTQIGMVYEQIVRMIFWSRGLENPNSVNQEAITVRSWTFSIRKRELRRLVDANGRDLIPRWIIQSLGDGKTHDDILDIVERLHHEIQQGILKDVPPVEFLPEVVDAYNNPSAQIPNHVNCDSSGELETAAISRPAHLGQPGETSESPVSFTKDSSPLEPVQEEGSGGDRSSENSSSPTPSATFDISRHGAEMGYHPQQHGDDQSKPAGVYSHGSRSPVDPAVTPSYSDSRGSLPYFDSTDDQSSRIIR